MSNKQKILLITKGLPASGKSFFAKKHVKERQNWVRINNDELRLMHFDRAFSKQDSDFINKSRNALIELAIKENLNIVIDNTNLNPKLIENYKFLAGLHNYKFELKDFTDVPLEKCIKRDSERNPKVGVHVIVNMHNSFLKNPDDPDITVEEIMEKVKLDHSNEPAKGLEQDKSLPKAIICDLDGTLALMGCRNPYDASTCFEDNVNEPVQSCVKAMKDKGYQIIFVSGRCDDYKEQTIKFIEEKAGFLDYKLYMRASKDYRKDYIVKQEIYNNSIKNSYYIEFILDDRAQVTKKAWREMGLTCFQVAEGDF